MTDNEKLRMREWLELVVKACIETETLPALVICYPADVETPGFSLLALGTLDDQQIALSLKEALLNHCAAKGVIV